MSSKYVSIGDYAVNLLHTGPTTLPGTPPDLSRGRTIVLLHGAGSTGAVWKRQLEHFSAGHSPIAFDQPGHGRSSGTEALGSVEACARLTLDLLDRLGVREAVLAGSSMGGAVALSAALEDPGRVRGLVLLSTAARLPVRDETLATWEAVMRGRAPQPFTADGYGDDVPFEVMREGWELQVRTDPRVRYFDLEACRRVDLRGRLREIGAPALVVTGSKDTRVDPALSRELADGLPDARFVEIGGSSFVSHVAHASAAITAGLCEVALVLYGSTMASDRFAVGTGGAAGVGDPPDAFEVPYGPTVVGSYAMAAERHRHEYGTTPEQLAEIAVTTRRHASLNPAARYRDPITIDDVLASRIVSSPLHLLDCCMISDGGGALVVTSVERARDLAKPPCYVLGAGEAVRHTGSGFEDVLEIAAAQAGPKAFRMAGLTPADIDLRMIYDSFTITVLLTLENLGFCERGEGGAFVENGRLAFDGPCPTNTDGGGLSSNHPGMRGIFLVIEAVKQLRAEAGDRQVAGCRTALCHGTGGFIARRHSGATLILGTEATS